MTTVSQLAAAADRKPRTRPAPSPRDQQIYLDYQTTGKQQSELAQDYNLTQCRISQIIRRVEKWLHATGNPGSGADDAAARQCLERRLQSERLNSVCREAMRHYHDQQKTVTHKK